MIKVLDILDSPRLGGINAHIFPVVRALCEAMNLEFHYAVLAKEPRGWLFDKAQSEGVQIDWIPCSQPFDASVPRRIKQTIARTGSHIIHTHGYRGNIYVRMMLDFRLARIPCVITTHGLLASRNPRLRFYALLARRPIRLANCILAVDKNTFERLLKRGVPKERLVLVPNAVSTFIYPSEAEISNLRTQLGIEAHSKVVLYFGRFEREKGVFELLDAHWKLSGQGVNVHTLLVGDGSSRDLLVSLARRNPNRANLHFLPPQVSMNALIALSDCIVLPSYSEGMPRSLLEAGSAGKPVVATAVGGIPDIVVNGVGGLLVPPRDVASLTSALLHIIRNPQAAAEMGRSAKTRVDNEFTMAHFVSSLADVYSKALAL